MLTLQKIRINLFSRLSIFSQPDSATCIQLPGNLESTVIQIIVNVVKCNCFSVNTCCTSLSINLIVLVVAMKRNVYCQELRTQVFCLIQYFHWKYCQQLEFYIIVSILGKHRSIYFGQQKFHKTSSINKWHFINFYLILY